MAKPEPKPTRADIRTWNRAEKTPTEAFCPKCRFYYPATSNAHAGH